MTEVAARPTVAFETRELHNRAHAAVRAQRDVDGWWGAPMETALVAVADAQHARGSQNMARLAYERLLEWLDEETPRALGDDAAAVALTARTARELRGGSAELTTQAAALVAQTCSNTERELAPLHVALAAWALDPLITDRAAEPWEQMREAMPRFSRRGLNDALVRFAETLADATHPAMDHRLADASTTDRTEECILLWLLFAAIRIEADRGRADSEETRPLLRRRAELLDYLCAALAGLPLTPAPVPDFDPFTDPEAETEGLQLFEAIMLDFALSGERPHEDLITLDEHERLDADRAKGRLRGYTGLSVAATLTFTGMAVTIAVLAHASTRLWGGIGVVLLSLGLAGSLGFLRTLKPDWDLVGFFTGLVLDAVVGALLIVEGATGHLLFGDAGAERAAYVGILLVALPFIIGAVGALWLRKK
jgi:hypothetical protein